MASLYGNDTDRYDILNATVRSATHAPPYSSFAEAVKVLRVVGPTLFLLAFIIGVVGNGLLIYIILANKYMRTKSNVLIVSLAIGDFFLLFVTVPLAFNVFVDKTWRYGLAFCKVSEFLKTLSMSGSVLTLTALSGDRLVAIVFPFYVYRHGSIRRTIQLSIAIWIISLAISTPDVISSRIVEIRSPNPNQTVVFYTCDPFPAHWGDWYKHFRVIFQFSLLFVVPMLVITMSYATIAVNLLRTSGPQSNCSRSGNVIVRMPTAVAASLVNFELNRNASDSTVTTSRQLESRRKVANAVLLFVVIFVVCWLPRHIYILAFHYVHVNFNLGWAMLKLVYNALMFIYSAANPFVLYVINDQFRCHFNHYLCGLCCRTRRMPATSRRGTQSMRTMTETGNSIRRQLSCTTPAVVTLNPMGELRERHDQKAQLT